MEETPRTLIVPNSPFPTTGGPAAADVTTQRNFVVGGYAECSFKIGAGAETVFINCFDWEVKPVFDYSNLTAHGDYWQVNQFLDAGWTARVRGYLTLLAAHYIFGLTKGWLTGTPPTGGVPAAFVFTGYSTVKAANGVGTSANAIMWQGTCGIKEGTILVPNTMLEQEITLIGTGTPTAGLGA